MTLQVHIGLNNERFMLGGEETPETFRERDEAARAKEVEAEADYAEWLRAARDYVNLDGGEIVEEAKAHLDVARRLEPPVKDGISCYDSRWSGWADTYVKDVPNLTTPQQVLRHAQVRVPFDHRCVVEGHKSEYAIFEKLVSEEFPFYHDQQFAAKENPLSVPETLFFMHNRLVSNVFYWHLRTKLRCQQDLAPRRIIEIGGGYGSLARIWLNDPAIIRYVIVDLPESLFFSEVCLRQEGFNVGYFNGADFGHRVLLVPVGRLNEYTRNNQATCDLVMSVGSLQEMSDPWVSYYMKMLDDVRPRYFYSLNYMGGPVHFLHESRNFWAPRPSSEWTTRSIEADVPLVKMMCAGRDFAEVIYERTPMPVARFSDWSVLRGATFNRRTYLEGLELLRQDFTTANGVQFVKIVLDNNDKKKLVVPKEIMLVINSLSEVTKDPEIKRTLDILLNSQRYASR